MAKRETKAELEQRLKAAATVEVMRVAKDANRAVLAIERERYRAEGRAQAWEGAFLAMVERLGDQ